MNKVIQNMGDTLRTKRQEMNLTLKEVENITSIRSNYLKALEEGRIAQLISPVYAKGFLTQYANFLGLDIQSLLKENPQIFENKEQQEFSYGIGTLEVRASSGGGVKWIPNIPWMLAALGVTALAWILAKFLNIL